MLVSISLLNLRTPLINETCLKVIWIRQFSAFSFAKQTVSQNCKATVVGVFIVFIGKYGGVLELVGRLMFPSLYGLADRLGWVCEVLFLAFIVDIMELMCQ